MVGASAAVDEPHEPAADAHDAEESEQGVQEHEEHGAAEEVDGACGQPFVGRQGLHAFVVGGAPAAPPGAYALGEARGPLSSTVSAWVVGMGRTRTLMVLE